MVSSYVRSCTSTNSPGSKFLYWILVINAIIGNTSVSWGLITANTSVYYKYDLNHSFAALSSVKLLIGIGGFFKANNIFITSLESPGFETIINTN